MDVASAASARRSATNLAGLAIPTETAFKLCFIVGAAAALAGVVITALIPPAGAASKRQQDVTEDANVPASAGAGAR